MRWYDIDHTDPQNDLTTADCITKLPLHRGWNKSDPFRFTATNSSYNLKPTVQI